MKLYRIFKKLLKFLSKINYHTLGIVKRNKLWLIGKVDKSIEVVSMKFAVRISVMLKC